MPIENVNRFHRIYTLSECRARGSGKDPAPHQNEAIQKLDSWHRSTPIDSQGGIMVLPTGAGKTFTSIRFLCSTAISEGYKVLWLAHTHHLLEQALHGFEGLLGLIKEPRETLSIRVVSGTSEHSRAHTIKASDDVLIITLQTARNAAKERLRPFEDFLESSNGKLFVVFDECHHSPAPSFRNLLLSLRTRFPAMQLLGLTATPVYGDPTKQGWLLKLFPQNLIYQAHPNTLIAAGILAKPVPHQVATQFEPGFDPREFRKWVGTYRDIPEEIITKLAESKPRNDAIVQHYLDHRQEFGKTIIFADRWFQCRYLVESLKKRGIKADAIYSKVEIGPNTVEERNHRTADENSKVLRQFQSGDLDVLVNIRMLTEGTDVPKVETVFLTRQTTSEILLTQMIGRALRGPKFGGTAKANIVSFIDNWKHAIPWALFDPLTSDGVQDDPPDPGRSVPVHLVSIELVNRLARQMDSGDPANSSPYIMYLPVGWYEVRFDATSEGSDDTQSVRQLRTVYESEQAGFQH